MADKRPLNVIVSAEPGFEEKSLELAYKVRDSWRKNQTLWSVSLVALACAAGVWSFWTWKTRSGEADANRLLGMGLVHLQNERPDSALASFDKLSADHGGISTAKASLLAGNILLSRGDWKGAEARFHRAIEESDGLPLLDGGARRGLATSLIEQKRYDDAAKELQKVLSSYAHVSVLEKDREKESAATDDLPLMSQVYFQLVLVQEKLNKKDDARKNAETIIRAYPLSEEAGEARKWLALQGLPSPT